MLEPGASLAGPSIGDAATLPGGVPPAELRDFLRDLIDRLVRLAHP